MSGSGSGPVIPPGYSPPLAVVTDHDHTAWIIIAASLGLAWTLLFAAIRIFVRWTVTQGVGPDDIFLGLATVAAVIQSALVLSMAHHGFGKSIELLAPSPATTVQKLYYASNIFFILGLGLSKISVIYFLSRLTSVARHKRVVRGASVFTAMWTIASTFTVALQCNLSHPWLIVGEQCDGAASRWDVISAFDMLIEVLLIVMAIGLVWGLQTTWTRKIVVVSAFSFRLPIIITIAFRLATFDEEAWTTNPTFSECLFVVWTQAELNYSIISATIPNLRPVMNSLNTQFGGLGPMSSDYYGSGRRTNTNYELSNLRSAASKNSVSKNMANQDSAALEGRSAARYREVWVSGSNVPGTEGTSADGRNTTRQISGDATSVGSNDSRRMIIRKDQTFDISYEE